MLRQPHHSKPALAPYSNLKGSQSSPPFQFQYDAMTRYTQISKTRLFSIQNNLLYTKNEIQKKEVRSPESEHETDFESDLGQISDILRRNRVFQSNIPTISNFFIKSGILSLIVYCGVLPSTNICLEEDLNTVFCQILTKLFQLTQHLEKKIIHHALDQKQKNNKDRDVCGLSYYFFQKLNLILKEHRWLQ